MTDAPPQPRYEFFARFARVANSGQARAILLHGDVHGLFHLEGAGADPARGDYVPLADYLVGRCRVDGLVVLVAELNGPIRIPGDDARRRLREGWVGWKAGLEHDRLVVQALNDKAARAERERLEAEFEANLRDATGRPAVTFEFLRQLTLCSRATGPSGRPYFAEDLLILVEAADMNLPAGNGDVASLSPADRTRVAIMQDWFSDPGFLNGGDTVVLLAEGRSLVHPRVARMPQVLAVEVPAPDLETRRHYIRWFATRPRPKASLGEDASPPAPPDREEELARLTAGLSIHALRQLLLEAEREGGRVAPARIVERVEDFIVGQLGEGVVEFKKPTHSLDDVVGFSRLKAFLREELIPRFRASGGGALPGAAVAGPIGGGKTFVFEAVASSLDLPVLVLKNLRSQWFGQTDAIFEKLRALLEALDRVVIFVDEADTQFGGVGADAHETERRLTGKIQAMMSDSALRGRVFWLLMTARIHRLSPDIRRPGRVGDLIVPVLDPEGEDRAAFVRWTLEGGMDPARTDADAVAKIDALTAGWSAAAFASLRSTLKARRETAAAPLAIEAVEAIVRDTLPPDIAAARRYQTLQALVNCTRRSLLPNPNADAATREGWRAEIRALEARGIS